MLADGIIQVDLQFLGYRHIFTFPLTKHVLHLFVYSYILVEKFENARVKIRPKML